VKDLFTRRGAKKNLFVSHDIFPLITQIDCWYVQCVCLQRVLATPVESTVKALFEGHDCGFFRNPTGLSTVALASGRLCLLCLGGTTLLSVV
jgi:hypothetical protein